MKLSKRETFMIIGLLFVVLIAGFWFVILSPANDSLTATQAEYDTIKAEDDVNQGIIDSVALLTDNRNTLEASVVKIENTLLPELYNEVIAEHLANIFEANGLKFITEISCDPLVTDQLLLSDNTYSTSTVQWVRVNMRISGTDGVTDGGIPAVGYTEFIAAVKKIEAENPDTIHVASISMEDTSEGFQYFKISVDVFAFNLPNRIETYDPTAPYITWDREPAATGGLFGVPYASLPPAKIEPAFFKPFATVQVTSGTPAVTTGTTAVTPPVA